MILECGSCAKMYRVRDNASPQPSKCPTCNGDLKVAGGGAPMSPTARVQELETRIQSLERELAESRSGRPTLSVETSPGISGFSAPVAELRAAAEKADRLERELLSFRSDMERKLKEKDAEITQLRSGAERETSVRRKTEAHATGLQETHARALEGKDKTIQALDASIASYRSKLEAVQKKLDAVEIQRLNDLNAFDTRIREKEESDRAALDRATQSQQAALSALRDEMETKIAEKDRLISDGRQALDREAGERRRLTETLNRLQENADRVVAEKETSLSATQATLASYKTKIETLQGRVDSLEQMRRAEHDQLGKQARATQSIRGRVDEAGHLATDLDHSLDSIEATIATLRDRARRLKETLHETSSEADAAAPISSASTSFAPPPEPEAESAAPVLSQADWSAPEPVEEPAPVEEAPAEEVPVAEADLSAEASAEAELIEEQAPIPVEEPPVFSDVTKTKIRPNDADEPQLIEEPVLAESGLQRVPEPELIEEPVGRTDEPSGVYPAAAEQAAPAASSGDETADIPLISPPEEEKPPAAPAKKEETKRKFSWQRK
jgi:DNA repair exonuclease SbcCD ATPase subunit